MENKIIIENERNVKCGSCNNWRTEQDFISNDRRLKSCNKCREKSIKYAIKNADKIKKWRINNADKIKEKHKKYYIENADKIIEIHKKYLIENADKIKEQKKEYNIKNADKIIEKRKQIYQKNKTENPLHIKFNAMINSSKTNDKKHNRIYEVEDYMNEDYLNEIWIKQNGKCFYDCCKVELSLDFNKDFKNPNQISVQRLNNDIAHTKDNVVISCYFCNCVKHMENCDNELN